MKKAAAIPWDAIEEKYAQLFPSKTGMPAKPLRKALGSLLIQKQYDYSDRELVEQIMENPYYQYFIGLPGFSNEEPYVPSLLVEFRKRLNDEIPAEINEMIILDATCAPQNISYPQDVNLLNKSRENLEALIDKICCDYNYYKPRMYRNNARRDYLNPARCRKRTSKKIRRAIKKQLQYIRPIVRGKAAAPVEFGAKLDLSIDEDGMARLEKPSFDAYNESDVLIGAIERYKERTGHYPQRALADKIYRNRENLAFCKQHGIRLSGPSLGRPKNNAIIDKKTEYADNAERVEVERAFSLAKRCYGLGRIMTKLDSTTRSSIALSILAMNVDRLASLSLFHFLISLFSRYSQHGFMLIYVQNNRCEDSVGY